MCEFLRFEGFLGLLRMRYKSSVLEYKAFPDGADSVIIGGPCGDVCMQGLASSLGRTPVKRDPR
jgi:hypothetical protein